MKQHKNRENVSDALSCVLFSSPLLCFGCGFFCLQLVFNNLLLGCGFVFLFLVSLP